MKYLKIPNNYKIYRQYDSRWGYLPYPVKPSTLASSGCGCCAITHCAIELVKYFNYTPKNVQPFMKNYAERGHGTLWSGINVGLEHYGLKTVKRFDTSEIDDFWKELDKGNRLGVLLFNSNRAPDGTLFTSGGHYIAFAGYKKNNKGTRHWLYLKDSGGRMNDGWYCYERRIKGTLKKLWTAELPPQGIILPERGYFKFGDRSDSIKIIQQFLKNQKLYKGKIGGRLGPKTRTAIKKFQKKYNLEVDGLWGKECMKVYNKINK